MSPVSIAALIQALMAVSESNLDLGQEAEEERGDFSNGEHGSRADNPRKPDGDTHSALDRGDLSKDAIDLSL